MTHRSCAKLPATVFEGKMLKKYDHNNFKFSKWYIVFSPVLDFLNALSSVTFPFYSLCYVGFGHFL